MRDFFHVVDGPAQEARDLELKAGVPRSGGQNIYGDPEFLAWMLGKDVLGDVERLWSEGTAPFGG